MLYDAKDYAQDVSRRERVVVDGRKGVEHTVPTSSQASTGLQGRDRQQERLVFERNSCGTFRRSKERLFNWEGEDSNEHGTRHSLWDRGLNE